MWANGIMGVLDDAMRNLKGGISIEEQRPRSRLSRERSLSWRVLRPRREQMRHWSLIRSKASYACGGCTQVGSSPIHPILLWLR